MNVKFGAKRGRVRRALTGLAAIGVLAVPFFSWAGVESSSDRVDIAIIVHPTNEVTDLSLDKLRALFNLNTQFWPQGKRVRVILPGPGLLEREALLKTVYRVSASDLAERWRQRIFAGEIPGAPSGASSPQALVQAVATSEEAVSAVRASAVNEGVRVLRIDGRLPGEPEYPLR